MGDFRSSTKRRGERIEQLDFRNIHIRARKSVLGAKTAKIAVYICSGRRTAGAKDSPSTLTIRLTLPRQTESESRGLVSDALKSR